MGVIKLLKLLTWTHYDKTKEHLWELRKEGCTWSVSNQKG